MKIRTYNDLFEEFYEKAYRNGDEIRMQKLDLIVEVFRDVERDFAISFKKDLEVLLNVMVLESEVK